MNVSATLNIFRLIRDPSLCLPQATISTFNQLPIPVSKAFPSSVKGKEPDIRAVVLDKDNCFAWPKENTIYKPYHVRAVSYLCFRIGIRVLLHNMSMLAIMLLEIKFICGVSNACIIRSLVSI